MIKKIILNLSLIFMGIGIVEAQTIYNYSHDSKGNINTRVILVLKTAAENTENYSEEEDVFSLYPNPVVNELTIDLSTIKSNKHGVIQIYNSLGQKLQTITCNEPKTRVDFSLYSKGIYYIEVILDNKKWVQELIKTN